MAPTQTINSQNLPRKKKNPNQKKKDNNTTHSSNETQAVEGKNQPSSQATKKKRNRRKNKSKQGKPLAEEKRPEAQPNTSENKDGNQKKNAPKRKRPKNPRKKKQRFPWRAQIPEHAVDPITLDPLDQLPYPPFALAAHEPYDPVSEWPIPDDNQQQQQQQQSDGPEEDEARRQQRILQEQWGKSLNLDDKSNQGSDDTNEAALAPKDRHYNLYDGRALAYYMVSQLQFIDPLNRRDVTRDELVNLDHYLRRHGFTNLNVTEAYDVKGVTLSTAGAAAHTAAGRAQLLQQEAGVLLSALFGGNSVASMRQPSNRPTPNNRLAQQYQTYESQQQQQVSTLYGFPDSQDDVGISGDAGILVIDDNMNPGLRGDAPSFVPGSSTDPAIGRGGNDSIGSLWSASHIAARHGHAARLRAHEFPSLGAPSTAPSSSDPDNVDKQPARPLPKTHTLAKISGVVKQTTAEERQRQWEAREAMKRKAALASLALGSSTVLPSTTANTSSLMNPPVTAAKVQPTEGQIERNRALADALGVLPATLRQQSINSGWARPTDPLAEFGEELQMTVYPDALILQARERLALVLKMEKKWKTFLEDDKSASLPLQPMDRATRAFVHHYSDFWNLHTESFDREPARYIHCVKTQETMAPYPLLSVAVRQWKGPRPFLTEHAMQQTAGQATRQATGVTSRNFPEPPIRPPLHLKPPSTGTAATKPNEAFTLSGAKPLREEEKASARFDGLAPQRTKLQLQPRTAPLEMPPFEPQPATPTFDVQEHLRRQQERMEEKARQEQAAVDAKRRALEAAFASDSEEDGRKAGSLDSDDWVEQEPLYQGSEDEDE